MERLGRVATLTVVGLAVIGSVACADGSTEAEAPPTTAPQPSVLRAVPITTTTAPPEPMWLGSKEEVEAHYKEEWEAHAFCHWHSLRLGSVIVCEVALPVWDDRWRVAAIELLPDGTWRERPISDVPSSYYEERDEYEDELPPDPEPYDPWDDYEYEPDDPDPYEGNEYPDP